MTFRDHTVALSFRYSRMAMRYLFAGFDYDLTVAAEVTSWPTAALPGATPELIIRSLIFLIASC